MHSALLLHGLAEILADTVTCICCDLRKDFDFNASGWQLQRSLRNLATCLCLYRAGAFVGRRSRFKGEAILEAGMISMEAGMISTRTNWAEAVFRKSHSLKGGWLKITTFLARIPPWDSYIGACKHSSRDCCYTVEQQDYLPFLCLQTP